MMTLLAPATLDEAHFGSCVVLSLTHIHKHRGTSSCGYEHTCTEADCSGSLGVFVSLGVTVRQSPAGVAAGHWQLNNPHLCLPTVWVYTHTHAHAHTHNTMRVYLGLKKILFVPSPSSPFLLLSSPFSHSLFAYSPAFHVFYWVS